MKKVLSVLMGILLIASFSLVAVQADEPAKDEEQAVVETGGYGGEQAIEAEEEDAEEADDKGKEEAEAAGYSEEHQTEKSDH